MVSVAVAFPTVWIVREARKRRRKRYRRLAWKSMKISSVVSDSHSEVYC